MSPGQHRPPPAATAPGTPARSAPWSAAFALLGRARQALAEDDLGALGQLLPLLDRLRADLDAPDARLGPDDAPGLIGLLDEAEGLAAALRTAHGVAEGQLRAAGTRAQAGSAYRRAGRL